MKLLNSKKAKSLLIVNKRFHSLFTTKKADANMWWIIAIAALVLLVVILILVWFRGSGDRAFGEVGKKIDSLGDCDNDNVANMWDKCKCALVGSNPEVEGCPDTIKKDTPKENIAFTDESCCKK